MEISNNSIKVNTDKKIFFAIIKDGQVPKRSELLEKKYSCWFYINSEETSITLSNSDIYETGKEIHLYILSKEYCLTLVAEYLKNALNALDTISVSYNDSKKAVLVSQENLKFLIPLVAK